MVYNNKKLLNVVWDIYRQMYKEATPSADFDKLVGDGTAAQKEFFLNYYLPEERQEQIIEEHCRKHKLTKRNKQKVYTEVKLGASPTSVKKTKEE